MGSAGHDCTNIPCRNVRHDEATTVFNTDVKVYFTYSLCVPPQKHTLLTSSSCHALIEEHRGLQPAAPDHGLDILPVSNQLDVGVVKQQPLLQLLTESICLIMMTKVADDAFEGVARITLGGYPLENAAEVYTITERVHCGSNGPFSYL